MLRMAAHHEDQHKHGWLFPSLVLVVQVYCFHDIIIAFFILPSRTTGVLPGAIEYRASVELVSGTFHDIVLEYREKDGAANIQVGLYVVGGDRLMLLLPLLPLLLLLLLTSSCCRCCDNPTPPLALDRLPFGLHLRVQFMWSSYSTAPAVIPESALFYTTPISGSPYNISVVPGAAAYPFTEAFGEGVVNASAGVLASFTIQAKACI